MITQTEEGHIIVTLGRLSCWKNKGVAKSGAGFLYFENRNSETMEDHEEGARVYIGFDTIESVDDTIDTLNKIKQGMIEYKSHK